MNEKNIEAIKDRLVSLGLPPEIEYDLRANICLQQDQFQLSHRQVREQDIVNNVFYFERKENEYCCSYYEACLRKKIIVPDLVINEIDVSELHERMAKIDWHILLSYRPGLSHPFQAIESIATDLKRLSVTPDGSQLSERLKIAFWMDTPLVSLIQNPGALRNQYEISQRFYFFQDEADQSG